MIVGLIGCGNIGMELALFLDRSTFFSLTYVYDVDPSSSSHLISQLVSKPKRVGFDELIRNSELIIEAASPEAVHALLQKDLSGKKVMVMSVSGLINHDIHQLELYVPSGAIAGIDALKAVAQEIHSLKLITTKSPKSLAGAPYLVEKNIDVSSISRKTTIFSGNLREAIEGFPKNINVAATISLAVGRDLDVEIVADPGITTNTHRILCEGSFGRFDFLIENKLSKNPKTSYLAVLSAIQCLKNIESKIKIGS